MDRKTDKPTHFTSLNARSSDTHQVAGEAVQDISVLLSYQDLSNIFMQIISVLVALLYVIMGATLDFEVIKKIAKKPLGPLVGIVCQYLFMPLVSGE